MEETNKVEETKKELTLEECLSRIEETLSKLDEEGLPLEESFALYQEGVELIRLSNEKIDRVEKQVLAITQNGEVDEFRTQA